MAQNGTKLDREVRRLLLSPAGRKALGKFGINVEIVRDPEALKEKPTVVVLCPTYRAPEPQMQDALAAMVKYTREKDFATVYGGPPLSASVVHWSRNGLITEHLKSGKPWTHVLFIDDDIVVEPDALERLLSHKKDIVAGLCTRRQDPPVPNIRYFDPESGNARQIWEWPERQLIEVDAVGTGLMLISQHALEQVAQAYFSCLWEQEFYRLAGERLRQIQETRLKKFDADKICYWFRFLPTPAADIEMGEDVTFCYLAKKYCGLPIFVDTSVQPGHLGPYAFGIKDFAPYRQECILRAKIQGEYPLEVPSMKISILCPTRSRPQNMKRLVQSLRETATEMPEIVFYIDEDDSASLSCAREELKGEPVRIVTGQRILMSQMWNRCAEAASGEILMVGGDDLIFRTAGWDDAVRRAFAAFADRIVLVHGDDGAHGSRFGTHPFVHRRWYETLGYVTPPYFSADGCDVWMNELADRLNRRVALPFVTEHMHPIWKKGEWDRTHKDRLERFAQDPPGARYEALAAERAEDLEKLKRRLDTAYAQVVDSDSDAAFSGGIPRATQSETVAPIAAAD